MSLIEEMPNIHNSFDLLSIFLGHQIISYVAFYSGNY